MTTERREHSPDKDMLANRETVAPRNAPIDSDDASASKTLQIPRQLGRYRIIRKLGQGAMGSVFLAKDEQLDRQVALKFPRGNLQKGSELQTRFLREAQAAASLHHANICPIYDIGEIQGIRYICMGYIEGSPLSQYAVPASGLTDQQIAQIILKIAKALAVAHNVGFIHRDLKPANIMIDPNNEPVILDFGLARRINRNEDLRITQAGAIIGSPCYMSPEQVNGDDDKVATQSDIYSLGVILYELLAGRVPFEGSFASVMGQIMTKTPDRPSVYRKSLNVRLETVCLRMMAKQLNQRFSSMSAVAEALQEYLDKFDGASPATTDGNANEPAATNKGEQRKQHIEQLIKVGDYGPAETLLVSLSREPGESLQQYAMWAASELPKLRKLRDKVRAGRKEMYETATRLMKVCDYEQVTRLLSEYPPETRTPKMQELLERAERLSSESDRLTKGITAAQTRGDIELLMKLLQQKLKIKPQDREARELYDQLLRRSEGPISKVLGGKTPRSVRAIPASVQWLLIFLMLLPMCAVPAYVWAQKYLGEKSEISMSEIDMPQQDQTKANGSEIVNSAKTRIDRPNLPPSHDAAIPAVESRTPVASTTSDSRPTKTENETEWSELFNGVDLSGWTYITTDLSNNKSNQSWHIDEANRFLWSDGSDWNQIQTEKEFQDFDLSFEFRVDSDANDALGVELRVRSPHELPLEGLNEWLTRVSPENQQVIRDRGNRIVLDRVGVLQKLQSGNVLVFGTTIKHEQPLDVKPFGRLIRALSIRSPTLKRAEEWNLCEIRCRGEMLTTNINGVLANEVSGLAVIKGAIAFKQERERADFRNIRIRDLSPESTNTVTQAPIPAPPKTNPKPPAPEQKAVAPWIDLLEANSLKKWKGVVGTLPEQAKLTRRDLDSKQSDANQKMRKHWRVVNGALEFDGNGDSIATESEYTDFELSLDWMIAAGADSGVYLRGCPQVQIWDPNSGKPNANLGSGGLYNNKTHQSHPLVLADQPVGQWNTMVIQMTGDHVTVDLNGRRVVQDTVFENYYEPTMPVYPRGRVELQSHGGRLWFRNIRIRDLSQPK